MTAGSPRVVVWDYGSGNLRSAARALARVGATVEVTADPAAAAAADGLVVPGVGAFAACRAGLDGVGAPAVLAERVRTGAPVLGICVGMQVLYDAGEEHAVHTTGLGLLPGAVTKLVAPVLPHMGWNTVRTVAASVLLDQLDGERFYFVHSYAARPAAGDATVAVSEHGQAFVAVAERGPVAATQFHPEKSGDVGAALLANWVRSLR